MQKQTQTHEELKPWDRQPGETRQAFEAFRIYRDQLSERSTVKVAKELGKSTALIHRWSSRWGWVMRAEAFDRHLDKKAQEKALKEYQQMVDRHTRIAMQIQEKAIRALANLTEEDLSPSVLLAYLSKATEIERLNRMSAAGIDEGSQAETAIEIVIEDTRDVDD